MSHVAGVPWWVMGVCWCVSLPPDRDSPPANEASEEAEEPMAVPEDLSAGSTQQQNNRGDKGNSSAAWPSPLLLWIKMKVKKSVCDSKITLMYWIYPMKRQSKTSLNDCSGLPSSSQTYHSQSIQIRVERLSESNVRIKSVTYMLKKSIKLIKWTSSGRYLLFQIPWKN